MSAIGGPASYVFDLPPWLIFILAELLSFGMMNIIAVVFERRTLLRPSGQYKAFYFGDVFCLPSMAMYVTYLQHFMPRGIDLTHRLEWNQGCIAGALVLTALIRFVDSRIPDYTKRMMWSPTKVYHDFIATFIFSFGVLVTLPVVWTAQGHILAKALYWVSFLTFIGLVIYDANAPFPVKAHVEYNWRRLRPINKVS